MKHRASYSMCVHKDGDQFLNKGLNSVYSFCTVPKVLDEIRQSLAEDAIYPLNSHIWPIKLVCTALAFL